MTSNYFSTLYVIFSRFLHLDWWNDQTATVECLFDFPTRMLLLNLTHVTACNFLYVGCNFLKLLHASNLMCYFICCTQHISMAACIFHSVMYAVTISITRKVYYIEEIYCAFLHAADGILTCCSHASMVACTKHLLNFFLSLSFFLQFIKNSASYFILWSTHVTCNWSEHKPEGCFLCIIHVIWE
jgi:hypothetical protein